MARVGLLLLLGLLGFILALLAPVAFNALKPGIMHDSSNLPPWFAFTFGFKAFKLLEVFPNWVLPPPVRMIDLAVSGPTKAQIIIALNKLGIADALSDSGQTAQQLATPLGIQHADKLARLLSAAAAFGVFTARQDHKTGALTFYNNALSAVLRQNHPNTVTHTIKGGMEALIVPFSYIAEGLQRDAVPFELAHGESLWEHLKRKPDLEHEFSLAMASQDKMGIHAVLTDYNWAQHSRVIDVGAAYGTFLVGILQRNPTQRGTLCDLPQVAERAEKEWRSLYSENLTSRTSFVGCNFLQSGMLPKPTQDQEAYVLRDILHDWSDDKVLIILRNLRQAIGNNRSAVVLLVETLLPGALAGIEPSMKHLLDITMLVSVDGKERTKQEFSNLLQQTGFVLKAVHATRGLYKVIEAAPDSIL